MVIISFAFHIVMMANSVTQMAKLKLTLFFPLTTHNYMKLDPYILGKLKIHCNIIYKIEQPSNLKASRKDLEIVQGPFGLHMCCCICCSRNPLERALIKAAGQLLNILYLGGYFLAWSFVSFFRQVQLGQ